MQNTNISGGAVLSPDRDERYVLYRQWQEDVPYVLFIGLNPSTADEDTDDRTIKRCIRFASDWGFGAFCMANLFAWRATKRKDMLAHARPVGAYNDAWLRNLSRDAGLIVCAWGADGGHLKRDRAVLDMLLLFYPLMCLGTTKDGHPGHPLYIKASKPLEIFTGKQYAE